MKKLMVLVMLALYSLGQAQVDTLYTKTKGKIPCKITEIGEFDIKYRPVDMTEGPVYVINRDNVRAYMLSSGYVEIIKPDELSVESQYKNIMDRRSVIKVHPFSFMSNEIDIAYERVLKVGTNIDMEMGYTNSEINRNQLTGAGYWNNFAGFYFKPGMKFLIGQDFTVRGLKYAHPLKGRYIKVDLAYSYMVLRNLDFGYAQGQQQQQPIKADLMSSAGGIFVNYGRQFLLGDIMTMEYYIGVGYTAASFKLSRDVPTYNNGYPVDYSYMITNYHGFFRAPFGYSFTCGLRLGFLLPGKKPMTMPVPKSK